MNTNNHTNQKFHPLLYRKFVFFLLLFFLSAHPATSQKLNGTPHAKLLTQVPFTTFTGGVMIVKVRLSNFPDTLNFILDTGSGGISLDSTTCLRLKIKPTPSDNFIIGIGGIRKVEYVRNQTLHIGSIDVDSLNLHVSDYEVLSSVYGDQIDGIIGFSFFSRYIVRIDYDSNIVSIYSKGHIKYPRGGFFMRPSIVSIPIESARIRDEKACTSRFFFDTGAGLCLLFSSDFVNDSAFFRPDKKMLPTQAQGMGGKANMKVTSIKEFRFGPYRFRNVPTHIFDDVYGIINYPTVSGLIGNDVLRRFNVILNYDKKTFYLTPNSHFRDPFDYSYTGLGLYWTDGRIVVGDVMKDSPADLAGFKVDDVVIGINNNLTQNLQLYKSMMQNVGQKLKFLISRPDGLVELNLKVKSIM
jgi:hypothetical protein